MEWEGKTPVHAVDNDVTPTVSNKCFCGDEVILVSSDEPAPMTRQEMDIQAHCLGSRDGRWEFCNFHKETWVRVKPLD